MRIPGKIFVGWWMLLVVLVPACSPVATITVTSTVTPVDSSTPAGPTAILPTATVTSPGPTVTALSPTPIATVKPTSIATPEPSPTSTISPSPSAAPTYAVLRGEVTAEHVVCHYGPGKPYLYKYGLVGGSNLEIIRRLDPPTFLEVRAIGGNNPCWVNAEYMDVSGDVLSVQPVDPREVVLPDSGYYAPPTGVSAARTGNIVTISWNPIVLKTGDDSEQYPYLVEAWLCQGGEIVFNPIGTYANSVQVTDEPGCAEPSYARLFGVEKHGYTHWVEVPWPVAN